MEHREYDGGDDDDDKQPSQLLSTNYLLGIVLTCCTLSLRPAYPVGTITHIYKDEETASEKSSNIPRTPQLINDRAGSGMQSQLDSIPVALTPHCPTSAPSCGAAACLGSHSLGAASSKPTQSQP